MTSPNTQEDPKAEGSSCQNEKEKLGHDAARPTSPPPAKISQGADGAPGNETTPTTGDVGAEGAEGGTPGPDSPTINMIGASPPSFVTIDQLMAAADGMKNMSLAHEIAVNNEFELESEPDDPSTSRSLEKQVRETVKRAFWDAFQERMQRDPPDLSMAAGMLEEVKEGLLGILLPQHKRFKEQIDQVLDTVLVTQQLEQGALDFDFYADYVTGIMAKLCAPARDESINAIKEIQEVTPKFKAIMETLELMRRDMANFTIKQMRPYIQQNSIEYERKKFNDFFEKQKALGINPLQYTEVWLQRNFHKLKSSGVLTPAPGDSVTPGVTSEPPVTSEPQVTSEPPMASTSALSPAAVLTQAYIEILEWNDPLNFPETLEMDQTRLMGLRDKLQTLGLITSVQLITFSVGGPPVEGVEALKLTLKDHCEVLLQDVKARGVQEVLAAIGDQVCQDADASLSERGLQTLSGDQRDAIKGGVASLGGRDNRVRQIMLNRLIGFVREGISGRSGTSGTGGTSLQIPKGCSAVQQELSQVLGAFLRLTSHNRSVFGAHYNQIIEALVTSGGLQTQQSQE